MPLSPAVLGITAAIELIRFVRISRDLEGKTDEQVMGMWAATRQDVQRVLDEWYAMGLTPSGENDPE